MNALAAPRSARGAPRASPWHHQTPHAVGRHPAHPQEQARPTGPTAKAVARWRGRAVEPALAAAIRAAIGRHRMLRRGDRVLVAVSGGADSVALLHVFSRLQTEWRLILRAVHVDHGLRLESGEDAAWVRALGERLGVAVTVATRDVRAACTRDGWSIEEGARRVRYTALLDVARQYSMTRIALAHTADDQAETVLMRLIRGAGLTGLAGIPFVRALEECTVIRPMLEVSREHVLGYLEAEGVAFRTDPSNADWQFLRNRVRHELLPLLARAYNPNIKTALVQAGQVSRDDAQILEAVARHHWRRISARHAGGAALRLAALRRLPEPLQRHLVRLALREVLGGLTAIEFRHWVEVRPLLASGGRTGVVDLPGGVRVRRSGPHLLVERAAPVSTHLGRGRVVG